MVPPVAGVALLVVSADTSNEGVAGILTGVA